MAGGWRHTLWLVWFAELTSITGFSVVLPILPFYVQALGITNPRQVEFWSGLIFSSQAITMALMGPVWGALSDRHGRKLMVERAMFGGAVIIGLMGLARNVQTLVVLRALQGMLTGTVTAATTLVASTTPREHTGYALGILQMGVYGGASVGPLLGGLIADTLGFRATFWTTGVLLLISGLLVAFLVHEDFSPPACSEDRGWQAMARSLATTLSSRTLLSALGVRLILRTANRLLGPILPLFVQALAASGRAPTLSGLVQTVSAATGAVGAVLLGRFGDRIGHRRILVTCSLASAVLFVPQFLASSVGQLAFLQALSGLAMGGILASLSATLASLAPDGRQGTVYGLDAAVVSLANAVGPMLGTSLAMAASLRLPFLGTAGLFALSALVAARVLPH